MILIGKLKNKPLFQKDFKTLLPFDPNKYPTVIWHEPIEHAIRGCL